MKRSWLWGLRDQCGICDFYHLDLDEVTWGCGRAATIRHQDLQSRRKKQEAVDPARRAIFRMPPLIRGLGWEDGSVGNDT